MGISIEVRGQLVLRFRVLFPHLNERQQRLVLGQEARLLGHGGVRAVARAARVSETTVRAGGVRVRGRRGSAAGRPGPQARRGTASRRGPGSGSGARAAGAGRTGRTWRPGIPAAVDHQVAAQPRRGVNPRGSSGLRADGAQAATRAGLQPAGQPARPRCLAGDAPRPPGQPRPRAGGHPSGRRPGTRPGRGVPAGLRHPGDHDLGRAAR